MILSKPYNEQGCQIAHISVARYLFFLIHVQKNYDRDMRVGVMSLIWAEKLVDDIFETLTLTGLPDFSITGLPDIHLSIYFHKNKGRRHQSW